MKNLKFTQVSVLVVGLVGLFLFALGLTTASLIWNTRQATLAGAQAQSERFVSGAQTSLNRSLLGVDVLLASMDALLGLSNLVAPWIDPKTANRLMQGAAQQNMMVRFVALINAQGRVIASSDPSGELLDVSLPVGFINEVLTQPVSSLVLSDPLVSFASSERVLYFARYIKLADSSKVLAVAEVQVPLLASILVQGVDISGLEVTLERGNGQLLASEPAQDELSGKKFLPALTLQSATVQRMAARLSGISAIVVTRPGLYRDVLVTASIPIDAALKDWRTQRNWIVSITLLFALMILTAGGVSLWYLSRMAQARQAIAQAKVTLDQALDVMVSGFVFLNARYEVMNWNRRFEETFPWLIGLIKRQMPFRHILEMNVKHFLPEADEADLDRWVESRMALLAKPQAPHEQVLPNGQSIQITIQRTPDGGVVVLYYDITELRRANAEIANLAFFDPLTHLPNRRLLMDRLQHALATSSRSQRYGVMLFLDLDHFKDLNDTLGHDVGDLLLQQVAQRLTACVRGTDTVARLGGDEFVVLLENLASDRCEAATMARLIGEKIISRLNLPYQLGEHTYHNTPSIGAALLGDERLTAANLLKQADIAMYQVKSTGRNGLCFFDPQMQAIITARAQLEEDLRTALVEEQFELYYQAQFENNGQVKGSEALLRWHHPLRGLVSPGAFIPLAEESDLILPLGQWVLRQACQQLALWQQNPIYSHLHLAVNVSARQFRQPTFVADVTALIRTTGIHAHLLKLELTESLVLDHVDDSIAKMTELRALGVRFSVDDFGTGHSSLAYLTRLPLDQLKIDQSFVRNIGRQPTDGVIVQTIIGMARNLGLEVIAEGVETPEQHAFLALHGCLLYQGYLFARPAPLVTFEALLSAGVPDFERLFGR